jgi:hypothetical protein
MREHAAPARDFVLFGAPFGTVRTFGNGSVVERHEPARPRGQQDAVARRSAAVQVDRDRGVLQPAVQRLERVRGNELVDAAHPVEECRQRGRRRQHDAVAAERARDRAVGGDRGKKVTQT